MVLLAAANFTKILLFDNLILKSEISVSIALVVCITLAITVILAKIIGCSLPLLAKKWDLIRRLWQARLLQL